MIALAQITGLVLAGGQGSRMGGQDKGLLLLHGEPLALHALRRLQPQVGRLAISANRNLDTYAAMGASVWTDAPAGEAYAGPLAGFLSGLAHCESDYLATVPCDTPTFPVDLVDRLAGVLDASQAPLVYASARDGHGEVRAHPVFCLMHRRLRPQLATFFASGQRRVMRWLEQVGALSVSFDADAAFCNANTPSELASLQGTCPAAIPPLGNPAPSL